MSAAAFARRCGRGLLVASLVMPLLVGGLLGEVEGAAVAASAQAPAAPPPVASPAGLGWMRVSAGIAACLKLIG